MGSERGRTLQFSRKQSGELLGNLDEAERQIRKYYEGADENFQIIEGIISPVPLMGKIGRSRHRAVDSLSVDVGKPSRYGLYTYSVTERGYVYGGDFYKIPSALFWSWIRSLDRCGVVTYFTINYVDTARLLVAIYNNEQKPPEEHDTLQRYTKPRIYLKEHNEFVMDLLYFNNVHKLGIGIKRAEALVRSGFTSFYDILLSSTEEIAQVNGLDVRTARRLLRALGKVDDEG